MKLHKLISRTVLATALLGSTLGGLVAGNNASAAPIGEPASNGHDAGSSQLSNLQVNNGLLTLDSVPTLNFSNSRSESGSNILKLDTTGLGTNAGLLEVTDYRNNSQSNDWQLTADMDPVQTNNTNNQKINTQWEIDLFNQGKVTNSDHNPAPKTQDTTKLLSNNNGSSDSNSNNKTQFVMGKDTSNGDNNGYGVNQLNYDDSNDARLITPNVAPSSYSTNINWHLTTNVSATNNIGNNQGGNQGNNQDGKQGNNQGGNQGNNQDGKQGNNQGQ